MQKQLLLQKKHIKKADQLLKLHHEETEPGSIRTIENKAYKFE